MGVAWSAHLDALPRGTADGAGHQDVVIGGQMSAWSSSPRGYGAAAAEGCGVYIAGTSVATGLLYPPPKLERCCPSLWPHSSCAFARPPALNGQTIRRTDGSAA